MTCHSMLFYAYWHMHHNGRRRPTPLVPCFTGALVGMSASWLVYHGIRGNKQQMDAAGWQTAILLLLSLAGGSYP